MVNILKFVKTDLTEAEEHHEEVRVNTLPVELEDDIEEEGGGKTPQEEARTEHDRGDVDVGNVDIFC